MRYGTIVEGRFIERPNRFIAYVDINGNKEKVHVKNTGRCRELLPPNAKVFLEKVRIRPGAPNMTWWQLKRVQG